MLKSLLLALALIASTWIVYAETSGFGFVDYDDPPYVAANAVIQQGLTAEGVRWVFSEAHGGNWHPVTGLSHMLDCELFGLDAGRHHTVNVILHIVSVLLLFGVLNRSTGSRPAAACVAALYALHPLHVESVAWISERKDVLSACFGFASLWAYAAWARPKGVAPQETATGGTGGAGRYVLALAFLALGLMAKPMLVTWPFVFLLVDRWPLDRRESFGRRLLEKLPFFALVLVAASLTYLFQQDVGAMSSTELVPFGDRLTNAVVGYGRYLKKLVLPAPMSVLYPHPAMPGGVPLDTWQVVVSGLVLVVLSAAVLLSRKGYAITGWLWFLGTLVPVIGLVQVGLQAIADRYTYLPFVGLFLVAVYGVRDALQRLPSGARLAAGSVLALLVLAPSAALARVQTRTWKDTRTLFEAALEVAPRSPLVLTTLGSLRQEQRDIAGARAYYDRALAEQPEHAEANYNLAFLLQVEGRLPEAKQRLDVAIEAQPGHIPARNLRGQLLLQAGDLPGALVEFEQALALQPDDAMTEMNVGIALVQLGRTEEALPHYERSVELDPSKGGARFNLANLLMPTDEARAIELMREAVLAEPEQLQFSYRLAEILARHPDPEVRDGRYATLLGERVASYAGGDPAVLDVLASAYAADGHFSMAVTIARNALHIARSASMAELAAAIETRIALYQDERPFLSAP